MNVKNIISLFLITLVLAGCFLYREQDLPPNLKVETPNLTTLTQTTGNLASPTATAIVLPTPSPTRTEIPTTFLYSTDTRIPKLSTIPTITATVMEESTLQPTATNIPVFSIDNAKKILARFVQDNGGCRLPCLMGLTPGKSSQADFNSFFRYFQHNAQEKDDIYDNVNIESNAIKEGGGVLLSFFENQIMVSIGFSFHNSGNELVQTAFNADAVQITRISTRQLHGHPYYNGLVQGFLLPNILSTFGPPQQVLIRTFPDQPGYYDERYLPFSIVLHYPKQGFLVEYMTNRDEGGGGFYVGCPKNISNVSLSTWNPEKQITIAMAVRYFSNTYSINELSVDSFKPIQEVSSFTIDKFYQAFKEPNSMNCISTPKDIWKNTGK